MGKTLALDNILSLEHVRKSTTHPWLGVLEVRLGNADFATGLILLANRLAVGNANDVTKLDEQILRTSTRAIFFKHHMPSYCYVTDYIIHPEYQNKTVNTLALLYLDCDINLTPINWLEGNVGQNTYAIGLTDQRHDFVQILYNMKRIDSNICMDFYIREEINFDYLWPEHWTCYVVVDVKKQCVFDSGMALVTESEGSLKLIGISVLGPGCALPSRYISFEPYVPWIIGILGYRRALDDKNVTSTTTEITAISSDDIISDVGYIDDDFYLQKLNDSTMTLQPKPNRLETSVIRIYYAEIYRDAGIIRTSKRPATGIYALSLYDLFYEEITCVIVSVRCDRRSPSKFWFDTGFRTDDMADIIKIVPHYKRGEEVPPKILYLTDSFVNYENIETANLVFKFEFTAQATINVEFYGIKKGKPRQRETNSTKPHAFDNLFPKEKEVKMRKI
nr:uncharacterized protein LOC116773413 [Danaus plexippus plexippus]